MSGPGCLDERFPALDLTASFGVATLLLGESADALLDWADHALREAKRAGRNCVRTDSLWVYGEEAGPMLDPAP